MPVYRVTIEGETYSVDVPNPRERPVRAIIDGETIEVQVDPGPGEVRAVGTPVQREVHVPSPAPKHVITPGGGAPGQIKAPLPGTIVSISVAVGDRVETGRELCIIEAMKMNNPIRALKPGTVKQVMISVGQQVQHGMPLFEVEG